MLSQHQILVQRVPTHSSVGEMAEFPESPAWPWAIYIPVGVYHCRAGQRVERK